MKTSKNLLVAVVLSFGLLSAATANAALLDQGGGMIYDTDLNITWLSDANYAQTSGYDADGRMTWDEARSWADNLVYGGYDDWRLPTTLQPDGSCVYQFYGISYGYNCTGSEMGHLFYNELGGVAGQSILTTHNANLDFFQNVQSNAYWSGTEYAPDTNYAWTFGTLGPGTQLTGHKTNHLFALAVRPGQVSAVPEPETYAMLLAGLGLIGFMARRRKDLTA